MDTNGDGLVDDLLATPKKKCGRKPLNLTHEEMKARRELQRKARESRRREAERKAIITALAQRVLLLSEAHTLDEIVEELVKDEDIIYKFNTDAKKMQALSGYAGERLKRKQEC